MQISLWDFFLDVIDGIMYATRYIVEVIIYFLCALRARNCLKKVARLVSNLIFCI